MSIGLRTSNSQQVTAQLLSTHSSSYTGKRQVHQIVCQSATTTLSECTNVVVAVSVAVAIAAVVTLVPWISAILHSPCRHPSVMVWTSVQGVLLPHEVQLLMNHEHHKPNFVLAVLTQVVDNLPTTDARKQAMDASLTSFHQAVGQCERMIKTPIPRSYTRLVLGHLPWVAFLSPSNCLPWPLLFVLLCPGPCLSSRSEALHLPLPCPCALFVSTLPSSMPFTLCPSFSPLPNVPLPFSCPFPSVDECSSLLLLGLRCLYAPLLTMLPGSASPSVPQKRSIGICQAVTTV